MSPILPLFHDEVPVQGFALWQTALQWVRDISLLFDTPDQTLYSPWVSEEMIRYEETESPWEEHPLVHVV
jgi:hypothetical protein